MSFRKLQDNLMNVLRNRVRNGEITERGLARITGVSQPHIHNVLKGVRELSPGLSDRILREFRLTVQDLMNDDAAHLDARVPIITDLVGPGQSFPRESYCGIHAFSGQIGKNLDNPAVFRLVRDDDMEPYLMGGDMVLVNRCPKLRRQPAANTLYLVELGGYGLVRYVRREGNSLYLISNDSAQLPGHRQHASLEHRDILEVIRGCIVWIGRQMETPAGPVNETGPAVRPPGGAGRKKRGGDGPDGFGAPAGREEPLYHLR